MTQYMLVRKSKKGNWKPCWFKGDDGVEKIGAMSQDKIFVEQQRDQLKRLFPAQTYAVVEIVED